MMEISLAWPSKNLEMWPSKASELPNNLSPHQECEFDHPIHLMKDISKDIPPEFFPSAKGA